MLWFCANNIAQILEYKAPKKAIQKYVLKNNQNEAKQIINWTLTISKGKSYFHILI